MNIDELLEEAENGKRSAILTRITEDALPFWEGCCAVSYTHLRAHET